MADRLTQLQDALDQLATQFYASLRYIATQAPPLPTPTAGPGGKNTSKVPAGDDTTPTAPPPAAATPAATAAPASNPPANTTADPSAQSPPSHTPHNEKATSQFALDQRELARDLILQQQQIELLIESLPGIGSSEREQEARLRALEAELRDAELERAEAARGRDEVLKRVEAVVGGIGAGRV